MAVLTLKELREAKQAKYKQMVELNAKAEAENRGFNDEEKNQWSALCKETDDLDGRIERSEMLEKGLQNRPEDDKFQEQRDKERFNERRKSQQLDDPNEPLNNYQRSRAFSAWALGRQCKDSRGVELAQRLGIDLSRNTIDFRFDRGVDKTGIPFKAPRTMAEVRAQSEARYESRADQKVNLTTDGIKAADGSLGGYTVPDELMRPLEIALLQWGGMRQAATVISTASGADLPIPTNDDSSQVGELVGENIEVASQQVTFAQLIMGAYKFSSKMVKCSTELLQDSAVNLPAFLGEALGTRIGRASNNYFTTGTGTSQPKGVVTAATNSGVTAGTAGKLAYTEVLALKHSVDPAYRLNGRFMMHDLILRRLKEMADTQGRPIWLPSLIPGEPPTFDGDPYTINQSMPTAATNKGLLYGDFSKYMIREVRGIEIMRLDERFAEFGQVAFIGFARMDGDLVDAGTHPVKYLTLA